MEVASPLQLSHGRANNKRSFAFSPTYVDPSDPNQHQANQADTTMEAEESSSYSSQPSKRRRFTKEGSSEHGKASCSIYSSSPMTHSGTNATTAKRIRSDHGWNQAHAKRQIVLEMQRVVDQQAIEIDRLKSEKATIEGTCTNLKSQHDKVVGENRILKRAVTIQQERQNQALGEIDAARKYRNEAEERIRRLEQMNLTLQFHLQQQQACNGNDFMGFSPRPPDIC